MNNFNVDFNCSKYIPKINICNSYEFDPCNSIYKNPNNYLSNSADLSTSFSNSERLNYNNYDCYIKCCCRCSNEVNELCENYTNLQIAHKQLLEDYQKLNNEKNSYNIYIQQLENELGKNNNNSDFIKVNSPYIKPIKTDPNFRYIQMINHSFENVLKPLSDLCNNPSGKLQGGVEYYYNKPETFDIILHTYKNMLSNPEVQNIISKNSNFPNNNLFNSGLSTNFDTKGLNYNNRAYNLGDNDFLNRNKITNNQLNNGYFDNNNQFNQNYPDNYNKFNPNSLINNSQFSQNYPGNNQLKYNIPQSNFPNDNQLKPNLNQILNPENNKLNSIYPNNNIQYPNSNQLNPNLKDKLNSKYPQSQNSLYNNNYSQDKNYPYDNNQLNSNYPENQFQNNNKFNPNNPNQNIPFNSNQINPNYPDNYSSLNNKLNPNDQQNLYPNNLQNPNNINPLNSNYPQNQNPLYNNQLNSNNISPNQTSPFNTQSSFNDPNNINKNPSLNIPNDNINQFDNSNPSISNIPNNIPYNTTNNSLSPNEEIPLNKLTYPDKDPKKIFQSTPYESPYLQNNNKNSPNENELINPNNDNIVPLKNIINSMDDPNNQNINNNELINKNDKKPKLKDFKKPLNNENDDDKYDLYKNPQDIIDSYPDKEDDNGNELKNLRDRLRKKNILDRLKNNKKNPKDKNLDPLNNSLKDKNQLNNKKKLPETNITDDNQFPIIDNLEGNQIPNNENQYPNLNKLSPNKNNLIQNNINTKPLINNDNINTEPNNLLNKNDNPEENDILLNPNKHKLNNLNNILNKNEPQNKNNNPNFEIESDDPGYGKNKNKRPKSLENKSKLRKGNINKFLYPNLKDKRNKLNRHNKFYNDGACWACDVGCSISTTGYSPMTFSPYDITYKRKDITYVSPNVEYEEYTKHKKYKDEF